MPGKRGQGQHTGDAGAMEYTVIKLRIHPSAQQIALIEKTFGCCRYLWNKMLADVEEFYAATDLQYIPTPAHYKSGAPFLREVDSQALCAVHQNLRQAFLNFFRSPSTFQHPRFKRKKDRRDSFTVFSRPYRTGPSIRLERDGLQMPKLGLVRAVLHRRPLHWWSLRSVTVTRTRSGKYFAAVAFAYPARTPETAVPAPERTISLRYSSDHLYETGEGNCPELPPLAGAQEKLERMRRKLSRMERGPKNYERQLQRIRLQYEHIVNQRKDFIHKESRRIANAWDAARVSDLDLTAVPQSGFGLFRVCLKYKLERQGKAYIPISPAAV